MHSQQQQQQQPQPPQEGGYPTTGGQTMAFPQPMEYQTMNGMDMMLGSMPNSSQYMPMVSQYHMGQQHPGPQQQQPMHYVSAGGHQGGPMNLYSFVPPNSQPHQVHPQQPPQSMHHHPQPHQGGFSPQQPPFATAPGNNSVFVPVSSYPTDGLGTVSLMAMPGGHHHPGQVQTMITPLPPQTQFVPQPQQPIPPTNEEPPAHLGQQPPLVHNPPAVAGLNLPIEKLKVALLNQLEYYFSRENLAHDAYLISQMDSDQYVEIEIIARFNQIKKLTTDVSLVTEVLRTSPNVQVDPEGKKSTSKSYSLYCDIKGGLRGHDASRSRGNI